MHQFQNEKKTYLVKLDKSKKGGIDPRVASLVQDLNRREDYYTTSSCSGRIYLWKGSGKKNQTRWLKVSHDLISQDFLMTKELGLVWLRLEDFILHVCCRDVESANRLLFLARKFYKKSGILSASNKLVVEIRGSEFVEMPLYFWGKCLFAGDKKWLASHLNQRMKKIWKKTGLFRKETGFL